MRVWLRKDECGFSIAFNLFFSLFFLGVLEGEALALVLFLWSGWCREIEMGSEKGAGEMLKAE